MSSWFSWSQHPEIGDFVAKNYDQHLSSALSQMIADRWSVHLSPSAVRAYLCHRRKREALSEKDVETPLQMDETRCEVNPPGSHWPDRRPVRTDLSHQELFHLARDLSEKREADTTAQTRLTCQRNAASTLPVAVAFWSDWQLGAHGVLMGQLEKDAQAIRDAEGLYVCVMGDLIQNLNRVKHPQSLHECVLPDPNEQEQLALYILGIARPKVECMVDGNHEMNSKSAAGLTLGPRWAKEIDVPYLWHGGLVNYQVGSIRYELGLRHKFINESSLNTTNVQRNLSLLWPTADVICLGHRHFNDLQQTKKPMKEQVWLRAGTYQKHDDYGMSVGHYSGSWGVPLTILFPDERCIVPVYGGNFYKGLQMLEMWRNEYRKGNAIRAA